MNPRNVHEIVKGHVLPLQVFREQESSVIDYFACIELMVWLITQKEK